MIPTPRGRRATGVPVGTGDERRCGDFRRQTTRRLAESSDVSPHSGDQPPPDFSHRASNRGLLPLSLGDYLTLLDWTDRQLRADKHGSIPSDLRPVLERPSINGDAWLDMTTCFGRWFHRAVGRLPNMAARAGRSGKFWFQGRRHSRLAFG